MKSSITIQDKKREKRLKKIFIFRIVFGFSLLGMASCATFETKEYLLPSQPLLFQTLLDDLKISAPSYLDRVKISYLDYDGNIKKGVIEAPSLYHQQIVALFKKLYQKRFRFATIQPLSSLQGDIEQALKRNATFAMVQEQEPNQPPRLVLMINPVTNPTLIKTDHTVNHKSYNVAVWPAQGVFSLHRTGRPSQRLGLITSEVAKLLAKHKLTRINGQENFFCFGLFVFNDQKTFLKKEKSAFKTASLKKVSDTSFSYRPLPENVKQELIKNQLWTPKCPLPLERFSYLTITYWSSDKGNIAKQHLIVADVAAESLLAMFQELFLEKYSFKTISSFSCRSIRGKTSPSFHSYGLAIDIDYDENPYLGQYHISPQHSYSSAVLIPYHATLEFFERAFFQQSSLRKNLNEKLITKMKKAGFYEWGGQWYIPVDYMHFQSGLFIANIIPSLDFSSGKKLFLLGTTLSQKALEKLMDFTLWKGLCLAYPRRFADVFVAQSKRLEKVTDEYEFFEIIFRELCGKDVVVSP